MRRLALIISFGIILLPGFCTVSGGRYQPFQYPETTAVLQVLYGDGMRACRLYTFCARKANTEGYKNIEKFFSALAMSESILAENHKLLLKEFNIEVDGFEIDEEPEIHGTRHNLELTANIGLAKIDKRFEVFLEMIQPENNAEAISNIKAAKEVKEGHLKLVKKALSSTGIMGIVSKSTEDYFVCKMCGQIEEDMPAANCEVCEVGSDFYEEVTAKWMVYNAIDRNILLADTEKAYAKRVYDAIFEEEVTPGQPDVSPDVFGKESYAKWGLGPMREFSDQEKVYIDKIEETAENWQQYSSIDLGRLTSEEKEYLEKMHDKYGAGPVDLSDKKGTGTFSDRMEELLGMVEVLSGTPVLLDVDIIFIKRATAP